VGGLYQDLLEGNFRKVFWNSAFIKQWGREKKKVMGKE